MRTITLASLLFLIPAVTWASGILIIERIVPLPSEPPPPVNPRLTSLRVKSTSVTTTITQGVARTHVDQVFANPTSWQLEGQYMFFLPQGASVDEFALYIDGQRTQGELLERDKAKGIYEGIVRRMQDPALLEYMGKNMFQARIFPIPANGERRIELKYKEVVGRDFDLNKYVYPIRTPHSLESVMDNLTVKVDVEAAEPVRNVFSPSHKCKVEQPAPNKASVTFEGTNVGTNQDFTLFFGATDKELGISLVTYRPEDEDDGYFLLLLSPSAQLKDAAIPKDVVFVLDTSGSMVGERIEQARKALNTCVQALAPTDRFSLVTFATEATIYSDKLLDASSENLAKAGKFIGEIKAIGGTNINESLLEALRLQPDGGDRPFIVCFITDGEPTVGVTDPKEILENVKQANKRDVRIFSMGVGNELNVHLVDEIAAANHGYSEYIKPKEDIELKVSQFYRRISAPVLTDVSVEFGKINTHDVYPKKLGDLFVGSQLTILGRYRSEGATDIVLKGKKGGKPVELHHDAMFPKVSTSADFVPAIWANRKVGYLLDEIRLHGENPELKDEVIHLAKKFAIVTPYTAYLVVEDTPVAMNRAVPPPPGVAEPMDDTGALAPGAGGVRRDFRGFDKDGFGRERPRIMSRSEDADLLSPEDEKGEGAPASSAGGAARQAPAAPVLSSEANMKTVSGRDAIVVSERLKKLKEAQTASADGARLDNRSTIGGRTFVRESDVWVDTSLPEGGTEVTIKYGSEAYFNLLAAFPDLARYASLGKNVKIGFKKRVLILSEREGLEKGSADEIRKLF